MKATEQYFPVVLFIMLYKVVLTFESVDEVLKCDHSNESYWAVLSCGAVCYTVQGDSNFWVSRWNPKVWPFKWKISLRLKSKSKTRKIRRFPFTNYLKTQLIDVITATYKKNKKCYTVVVPPGGYSLELLVGGGGGGTVRFSKSWSYFRPNYVIGRYPVLDLASEIHTHFQTLTCFQAYRPKWLKFIPYFRPKRLNKPYNTLWSRTYLYTLYRGVALPPTPPAGEGE